MRDKENCQLGTCFQTVFQALPPKSTACLSQKKAKLHSVAGILPISESQQLFLHPNLSYAYFCYIQKFNYKAQLQLQTKLLKEYVCNLLCKPANFTLLNFLPFFMEFICKIRIHIPRRAVERKTSFPKKVC